MPTDVRPRAIVFDLDGTLVDTVPSRIAGWLDALDEHSIPVTAAQLRGMIGMDGRRLAREVADASGRRLDDAAAEEIDRRAGQLFDLHNCAPRLLPGAAELLEGLDGGDVIWAIATSSRAEQVATSVAALGLRREPRIIDGSRVSHAKPAPDLLLLAARELGVAPVATWYVGDSTWDMRAAVAAGMIAIGVLAGSAVDAAALEDAGAELVVATLRDLKPGL